MTRLPGVKVDGLRVVVGGSREFPGDLGYAQTAPDGHFEFGGLDEGKANVYLSVDSKELLWTSRTVVDVELKAGGTTEVEIELIQGVRVEGQVLDADSGLPVAGVGVGIEDPGGMLSVYNTTDKEGRYRFRIPPGRTVVYVCGPVPAEYPQTAQLEKTVEVEVPDIAREFTLPRLEIRKEKREE